MTDREIMEHLLLIYNSLQNLTEAVKLLLEESMENDRKIGIFKQMSEDMEDNAFWRFYDKKRS